MQIILLVISVILVYSDHTHFFEHIQNNGIVSSYIYDQRDDFKFKIDKFPFLDKYVPRSPSIVFYITQLIPFASVCSNFFYF